MFESSKILDTPSRRSPSCQRLMRTRTFWNGCPQTNNIMFQSFATILDGRLLYSYLILSKNQNTPLEIRKRCGIFCFLLGQKWQSTMPEITGFFDFFNSPGPFDSPTRKFPYRAEQVRQIWLEKINISKLQENHLFLRLRIRRFAEGSLCQTYDRWSGIGGYSGKERLEFLKNR